MRIKVVRDFKRGEAIPVNSKYLGSRLHKKTETHEDHFVMSSYTYEVIVEEYYIDTYEVIEGEEDDFRL